MEGNQPMTTNVSRPFYRQMREHVEERYAPTIGLRVDGHQQYRDRIAGTLEDGSRAVVLIRLVGSTNAGRYRRWVTYRAPDFRNMAHRPTGWHYYILMVGLLPDGGVWWTSLYDEEYFRRADIGVHAEEIIPGLYRLDPGLTQPALVGDCDLVSEAISPDITVETADQPDEQPTLGLVEAPHTPTPEMFTNPGMPGAEGNGPPASGATRKGKDMKAKHPNQDQWREVFPSDDRGGNDPERREMVMLQIEVAMDLLHDPANVAVLPGDFLVHLSEHDLPYALKVIGTRLATRIEQSYSMPRAKAEKE